ncbi:AEC family transporter [Sphingobium sp.]|uniref:AEC family transporter n=1 Tax=Sphingobium sp. TaxID=1912891 RepID=UPI002C04BCDD|nr:AEC family transporter [Sphingobium sp.]HUD93960.1 AEC family transporter [Sphingobium sp.]
MAMIILGALIPVFGLILLGYGCGRFDLLGDRAFEVLNRFVIAITLPVLTFRSIARMDPADLAQPSMMIAVVGGALATYAIGFAIEKGLGRSGGEANIAGLCASFSNTGFVGLPIALLTFGTDTVAPVAVTMLLYSAVVFTVGVVMSEMAASHGDGMRAGLMLAGRSVARNPLILLSSLGVVWCLLRLPLTGPFDVLLSTLAQATAPCALTAIGIFIALPREKTAPGPIGRALVLKLGVHPLLTAGFILLLPPMPTLWAKMAVLMAAMPSGASSFVLAGKAGRWAMELSAWAVMLSTTSASLSLIAVLWWLGA